MRDQLTVRERGEVRRVSRSGGGTTSTANRSRTRRDTGRVRADQGTGAAPRAASRHEKGARTRHPGTATSDAGEHADAGTSAHAHRCTPPVRAYAKGRVCGSPPYPRTVGTGRAIPQRLFPAPAALPLGRRLALAAPLPAHRVRPAGHEPAQPAGGLLGATSAVALVAYVENGRLSFARSTPVHLKQHGIFRPLFPWCSCAVPHRVSRPHREHPEYRTLRTGQRRTSAVSAFRPSVCGTDGDSAVLLAGRGRRPQDRPARPGRLCPVAPY